MCGGRIYKYRLMSVVGMETSIFLLTWGNSCLKMFEQVSINRDTSLMLDWKSAINRPAWGYVCLIMYEQVSIHRDAGLFLDWKCLLLDPPADICA